MIHTDKDLSKFVGYVGLGFIALFLILFLVSCKTTRTIEKTDTIYISKTDIQYRDRVDSVYIDKWRDRYMKGDTCYITQTEYVYKYILRADTIIKTDTIKEKETDKETTTIVKKVHVWKPYFFICIAVIAVCLLWKYIKPIVAPVAEKVWRWIKRITHLP